MNLSASLRSRWPLLAPLATTLVIALLPTPAGYRPMPGTSLPSF